MKLRTDVFLRPRFLFCLFIALVAAYGVARLVRSFDREDWGITVGSRSQAESKASGFYVGTYVPTKRYVTLRDRSVVQIPDAWVEHCWKPKLGLFLNEIRSAANGYYLYIPIHASEITDSHGNYKMGLRLAGESMKYSCHPGIGFDSGNPEHGFQVYLDSLPQILTFSVVQKRNDSWTDVDVVETIQFNRGFQQ